jgi:arabinoxylan arabinofuranohydrolase
MKAITLLAILTLLSAGNFAKASDTFFTATGNPVLPDFHADPSARVFNGTLYVYPSHDIAGSTGWNMVDWDVFSTDDMVHWTNHGVIFGLKDITWAKKYAWAPDCVERDGKYYFYFPADGQIGVAVGDSPVGPFKDALGKPLIARNELGIFCIDPCPFIDDDGQAYLYFGNSMDRLGVVKLGRDMISRDGPAQTLNVFHYHEGIWVFKRNDIYYAIYPSHAGKKIANLMEYSMGKTPLGPFEYKGVILDNDSRNIHGSVVQFKNQWYLFYHVAGPSPYERRVCVEKLFFNDDGTIKPMRMSPLGTPPQ